LIILKTPKKDKFFIELPKEMKKISNVNYSIEKLNLFESKSEFDDNVSLERVTFFISNQKLFLFKIINHSLFISRCNDYLLKNFLNLNLN
jgi:hypothetical protein